jgi:hypothetical protein
MTTKMPFRDLPEYGLRSELEFDDSGNVHVITTYDSVKPQLDLNAAMRSHTPPKPGPGEMDMRLVASIPVGVQFEWVTKYGVELWREDHMPKVRRLLNSSDYRYLKTRDIIL